MSYWRAQRQVAEQRGNLIDNYKSYADLTCYAVLLMFSGFPKPRNLLCVCKIPCVN